MRGLPPTGQGENKKKKKMRFYTVVESGSIRPGGLVSQHATHLRPDERFYSPRNYGQSSCKTLFSSPPPPHISLAKSGKFFKVQEEALRYRKRDRPGTRWAGTKAVPSRGEKRRAAVRQRRVAAELGPFWEKRGVARSFSLHHHHPTSDYAEAPGLQRKKQTSISTRSSAVGCCSDECCEPGYPKRGGGVLLRRNNGWGGGLIDCAWRPARGRQGGVSQFGLRNF